MENSVDIVVAVAVAKLVQVSVLADVRVHQRAVARIVQGRVLIFAVNLVLSIVTRLVRIWVLRVCK